MIDAPMGWNAVLLRTATAAVIAFVVLQAKEFVDAGRFDTPGTGADAVLIGAGIFLISALQKVMKS